MHKDVNSISTQKPEVAPTPNSEGTHTSIELDVCGRRPRCTPTGPQGTFLTLPPSRGGHKTPRPIRKPGMKLTFEVISMDIRGWDPRPLLRTITFPVYKILYWTSGKARVNQPLNLILRLTFNRNERRRRKVSHIPGML